VLGFEINQIKNNMPFLDPLHKVMNRGNLTAAEAQAAMQEVFSGDVTTPQLAAFLAALRVKGETAEEIEGFARAMRDGCLRIEHGIVDEPVLDTCGTGGDALGTINISTAAAFLVAAAGVRVAKHGNRSVSSLSGSADVLEALGAHMDVTPERVAAAIREIGIGFLFSPALHPAMKHAMPARKELKTRTVFNLLGPLANPAGATVQIVGAPSADAAHLIANALARLGLVYGFVVHGEDGLDEVTVTTTTVAYEVHGGEVTRHVFQPEDFGVGRSTLDAIHGGGPQHNAGRVRAILHGERGPQRDIVVVNAALAIYAAHRASEAAGQKPIGGAKTALPAGSFLEAARIAAESIDSGAAAAKLESFVAFTAR
jgi:anthranilate phosphoribosyltransferase